MKVDECISEKEDLFLLHDILQITELLFLALKLLCISLERYAYKV